MPLLFLTIINALFKRKTADNLPEAPEIFFRELHRRKVNYAAPGVEAKGIAGGRTARRFAIPMCPPRTAS